MPHTASNIEPNTAKADADPCLGDMVPFCSRSVRGNLLTTSQSKRRTFTGAAVMGLQQYHEPIVFHLCGYDKTVALM